MPLVDEILIALLQELVPPDKQGRVFALIVSGAASMTPIGLAIAGPISDFAGVSIFFILAGIGNLIPCIAALFSKSLMGIEKSIQFQTIEESSTEEDTTVGTSEFR